MAHVQTCGTAGASDEEIATLTVANPRWILAID
jgi:hypothetical protein